ncbi:MAG: DUF1428 domain-containing protein [Rhodospirillaceae bacterium]|nr:DUF1428 domain-containing protein [Rhodospirillaceae bacterium]MDD9996705.1 DUF1428 domain-containing protein [Rhodospirillaceae bacterium]
MTYVNGMLAAVPTANKEIYREMADQCSKVFKKHGALTYVECWGDDVPEGKLNSMHTAVLREPDETVVFSWVTWPSKEARDAGMQKVFSDPDMPRHMDPMPFDAKRMIFGGFNALVEA